MGIKEEVKENWALLSIVATALASLAGWGLKSYVEDYIDAVVESKMVDIGEVSADRVAAIEKDVEENRQRHAADADRLDVKVERIVQILLEE